MIWNRGSMISDFLYRIEHHSPWVFRGNPDAAVCSNVKVLTIECLLKRLTAFKMDVFMLKAFSFRTWSNNKPWLISASYQAKMTRPDGVKMERTHDSHIFHRLLIIYSILLTTYLPLCSTHTDTRITILKINRNLTWAIDSVQCRTASLSLFTFSPWLYQSSASAYLYRKRDQSDFFRIKPIRSLIFLYFSESLVCGFFFMAGIGIDHCDIRCLRKKNHKILNNLL